MKSNKGVSLTDVVIAVLILSMFVGVIGTLFYQIAFSNEKIKLNAISTYYAVKIAEEIDMKKYEEVTNDLNTTLVGSLNLPEPFSISINVENYNKDDPTKMDIIKIANIEIRYTCYGQEVVYKIDKLKIKE